MSSVTTLANWINSLSLVAINLHCDRTLDVPCYCFERRRLVDDSLGFVWLWEEWDVRSQLWRYWSVFQPWLDLIHSLQHQIDIRLNQVWSPTLRYIDEIQTKFQLVRQFLQRKRLYFKLSYTKSNTQKPIEYYNVHGFLKPKASIVTSQYFFRNLNR